MSSSSSCTSGVYFHPQEPVIAPPEASSVLSSVNSTAQRAFNGNAVDKSRGVAANFYELQTLFSEPNIPKSKTPPLPPFSPPRVLEQSFLHGGKKAIASEPHRKTPKPSVVLLKKANFTVKLTLKPIVERNPHKDPVPAEDDLPTSFDSGNYSPVQNNQ